MDVYADQGKIDVYLGDGPGILLPTEAPMYDTRTFTPLGKQFILGLLPDTSTEPFRAGFLPSLDWEHLQEFYFGIHPQYLQHVLSAEPTQVDLDFCGFDQGRVTLYGLATPHVHERLEMGVRERK